MLRTFSLAALLALACAAPSRTSTPAAAANTTAAPLEQKQAVAAAPKSQLVCRMERPLGSNYARRVCYRPEELDESARQAQDALLRQATQGGNVQHKAGGN